ncbi:hypothetical protein N2152v2_004010 [Parachlorella kessleri]
MYRPQFLLFGDSITQRSFQYGGWGAHLANAYQRKVDVLNRGYSGYNSRWALQLLDRVLPEEKAGEILLATVFFGANDAALAERTSARQHVPLLEYRQNLRLIVLRLQRLRVQAIVLITPPPISEPDRVIHVEKQYGVKLDQPERTNAVTGQYAKACIELGQELGLPVLDLWSALQAEEGWQRGLLEDGLHLTQAGNQRVAQLLLKLIEQEFPKLRYSALPDDAPLNADIDDKDPASSFQRFYAPKGARLELA